MKKPFITTAFAIFMGTSAFTTLADDDTGFYLQLRASDIDVDSSERFDTSGTGNQRERMDIDGGDGFSGIAGYQTENFRFEFEYLSFESEFQGDSATRAGGTQLDVSGPFVNFWYLTPTFLNERLQPYFGGGLGRMTLETAELDENKNAMMIGGGLDFRIIDNLEVGLGVRYLPSSRYTELDPGQASTPIFGGNNSDNFVVEYRALITQLSIKLNFF